MVADKARQRSGHRSYSSKIVGQVRELLDSAQHGSPIDRVKLICHKKTLMERINILQRLDEEILSSIEDGDLIEKEICDNGDYKASIDEVIIQIEEKLRESDVDNVSINSRSSSRRSNGNGLSIKLPKINLKTFNGEAVHFQSFWDIYHSTIHENEDLDEVSKFNYLKGLLSGPALSAISGLSLTAANYNEAVDILKKRYGKKQVLINSHIDKLVTLKSVLRCDDDTGLRNLLDTIEVNVRNLQSLQVAIKDYGPMLNSIIMSKLPNEIRLVVTRLLGHEDEWDINEVLRILKHEVESRELTKQHDAVSARRTTNYRRNDTRNIRNFTASALLTGTGNNYNRVKCCYCNDNHNSSRCHVVTNPSARRNILMRDRRCFACLKPGHSVRECRSKWKCFKCNGRHHISICNPANQRSAEPRSDLPPVSTSSSDDQGVHVNVSSGTGSSTLLQTAWADVTPCERNYRRLEKSRLLFDPCSQKSFITKRLKDKLHLRSVRREKLVVKGFGKVPVEYKDCDVVRIRVRSRKYNHFVEVEAMVVPLVCAPISNQRLLPVIKKYDHLKKLDFADSVRDANKPVDILIGADFYWDFTNGKVIRGSAGPIAIDTKLGWVVSGPTGSGFTDQSSSTNLLITHVLKLACETETVQFKDKRLEKNLEHFWNLESMGIKDEVADVQHNTFDKFKDSIKFDDEQYTVRLPWKENIEKLLPDNYKLCHSRLQSLYKNLKKNPELLKAYDDIMKQQEADGIIENVPQNKFDESGKVHYIPHQKVVRDDKITTKLRIVYDASASTNGISLNECLESGPCLLPKIFDILIRFRAYRYALTSDIKSAFLNIKVSDEDRDCLRFLWFDDVGKENPKIVAKRFTSVIFGVTSSPFLLAGTLLVHMESLLKEQEKIGSDFLSSLYVDDNIQGSNDKDYLLEYYKTIKSHLLKGGFRLRKWNSNDAELQQTINDIESNVYHEEDCGLENDLKVLGVKWSKPTDELISDVSAVPKSIRENEMITKRTVLKTIASIYDPLGVLSPVVVSLKYLFQDLCKIKCNWDDKLPHEFIKRWSKLCKNISQLEDIHMPRYYFDGINPDDIVSVDMHGFSDASKLSYAAVVYLCAHLKNGERVSSFVGAKTRVAPAKTMTIPRLELMGCLILSRLMKSILESLKMTDLKLGNVYGWTDSMDCIYWINDRTKIWKVFIQNRVAEIRDNVNELRWNHCPGLLNPADIPSRGLYLDSGNTEIWLKGPEYLLKDQTEWPVQKFANNNTDDEVSATVMVNSVDESGNLNNVIDIERYSDLNKLFRVTAYVKRFIKNCKVKMSARYLKKEVLTSEIFEAKNMWLKCVQSNILKDYKKYESLQESLGAYLDKQGLIRLKGRLNNAPLSEDEKNPILIPKEGHFTKLLIFYMHQRVLHSGVNDTLTAVRAQYWILQGRQRVKNVLHNCFLCKKINCKPFKKVKYAQLPEFRLSESHAFKNVGIDYLGPLYIKSDTANKKVWVALFTCASTRAVHLELVNNIASASFINCLKRFVSRRGIPELIITDNATCFTGSETQSYAALLGVKWKFILPASPWWGGFWERLVQMVKKTLKKLLGKSKQDYENLNTVLIEIEGMLNCRPLSYINSEDVQTILTPSHLLIGRRLLEEPVQAESENQDYLFQNAEAMTQKWKNLNGLLKQFWSKWKSEYLTGLREFQNCHNVSPTLQVKEGDVVLIEDNNTANKLLWKMGVVVKLIHGRDGLVRGCEIQIKKRNSTSTIYRPVNKLCYFEVTANGHFTSNGQFNKNGHLYNKNIYERPRRSAAGTGELIRRLSQQV